jgi:hypothetical protein
MIYDLRNGERFLTSAEVVMRMEVGEESMATPDIVIHRVWLGESVELLCDDVSQTAWSHGESTDNSEYLD